MNQHNTVIPVAKEGENPVMIGKKKLHAQATNYGWLTLSLNVKFERRLRWTISTRDMLVYIELIISPPPKLSS
jgi:hypothetical protein